MKPTVAPQALTPSQIKLVIELLELHQFASTETAARFNRSAENGVFSLEQEEALEMIFALEEKEIPDALFEFVDDDARDLVRDGLAHEARLSFVRA